MNDRILTIIFWLCFGATVYTYFLYPLLLYVLTQWLTPKQSHRIDAARLGENNPDAEWPSVTMVISAYNEENILIDKIKNCQEIAYPPERLTFRIGSDGSTDGTARILQSIEDHRFEVVIRPVRRGKVQMLNHLMKQVNSDLVVFSDANTMYQPDAVYELVRSFQHPSVGAVMGKLELAVPANETNACQTEGLYWRYENRIKEMESVLGAVPSINGGMFAIRTELYEPLPDQSVTEDQVLGMKIMARRFRCLFAPNARGRETVSTWKDELRRRIRISAGNFQSLFLVPGILNPGLGWVCFAFFSHKLLRWLVPFFLVGMLWANLLLVGKLFYDSTLWAPPGSTLWTSPWLSGKWFYGSTLLLQGLFYLSGLIGAFVSKVGGIGAKASIFRVFSIPKYFILMNFAIFLGCVRFILRRQQVTWAKAQRKVF